MFKSHVVSFHFREARTFSASSSFKIDNSSSLILNKTLESSNKLDDLLKRCREIGSNETKINNEHVKTTSLNPSFIGKKELKKTF